MFRYLYALLLINMTLCFSAYGQSYTITLSGPTSVNAGTTTYTYNATWKYNGVNTSPPAGGSVTWTVYGGTAHSSGNTYAAISWMNSGSILYQYVVGGTTYCAGPLNVSTNNCAQNPSLTFSLDPSTCSPRKLTYTGTRPPGITWYWQTSDGGTSDANSTNTYNVTSPGTYYVRAYNTASHC